MSGAVAPGDIVNPEIGERVRVLRSAADTGGALLETEQWLDPGGAVGTLHVHPEQEERFIVLDGELRVRIGRRDRVFGPGETAVVAPGTPHRFANASGTTVHFRAEVRPALRTEELLRRLAALAQEHGATPDRRVPLRAFAPVALEFHREVRLPRIPAVLQRLGMRALAGRRTGPRRVPPAG